MGPPPQYDSFVGSSTRQGQALSYQGFSSVPSFQSFEGSAGRSWGRHRQDNQRPTASFDPAGKGSKSGKGSPGGKVGLSGKAPAEPEQKPRCGGVIAELTSDGRLGDSSRHTKLSTPSYASHPARPQAFEHYSHTSGYEYRHGPSSYNGYKVAETDDDDWAKNPDIFSSVNPAFDHVHQEVSWKGSQPARMPYAGIAAELTNDGRLRTDWWAPEGKTREGSLFWKEEGHAFESSKSGKGHDAAWSREWRGSSGWDEERYGWAAPASKGKGKHGNSQKGKDKGPSSSLDRWYGWSKSDAQVRGSWQKGAIDMRTQDMRTQAYGPERTQDDRQYHHWQAGELRDPQQEVGFEQNKKQRRRKKKKAPSEDATMGAEEREVLARARREELSAEKEAEAKGMPRLLQCTKEWEEVVADEHLCSWMSIRRSNPAVLEEDFQLLLDRIHWKDVAGNPAEGEKAAWMVADGYQCHRCHDTVEPVVIPDWMSSLMERWLSVLDLERNELPNCIEVKWYDAADASYNRWLSDDEALFRSATQDIHVIYIALGGPRVFRAGLRCGARKNPVRGTISEVTLSHGDTCLMEGRFQKHFVHQTFARQDQKDLSPNGYLHVAFRWIANHSRNYPLHEQGASEDDELSEDDASSGSDDLGDGDAESKMRRTEAAQLNR